MVCPSRCVRADGRIFFSLWTPCHARRSDRLRCHICILTVLAFGFTLEEEPLRALAADLKLTLSQCVAAVDLSGVGLPVTSFWCFCSCLLFLVCVCSVRALLSLPFGCSTAAVNPPSVRAHLCTVRTAGGIPLSTTFVTLATCSFFPHPVRSPARVVSFSIAAVDGHRSCVGSWSISGRSGAVPRASDRRLSSSRLHCSCRVCSDGRPKNKRPVKNNS